MLIASYYVMETFERFAYFCSRFHLDNLRLEQKKHGSAEIISQPDSFRLLNSPLDQIPQPLSKFWHFSRKICHFETFLGQRNVIYQVAEWSESDQHRM